MPNLWALCMLWSVVLVTGEIFWPMDIIQGWYPVVLASFYLVLDWILMVELWVLWIPFNVFFTYSACNILVMSLRQIKWSSLAEIQLSSLNFLTHCNITLNETLRLWEKKLITIGRSSWLLHKFSSSARKEMFREQYRE